MPPLPEKAAKQKAVKDVGLSARPCKQQKLSKYTKNKDILDMDYCRMLVTTLYKYHANTETANVVGGVLPIPVVYTCTIRVCNMG